MRFFSTGKVYDFMGPRRYFIGASALLVAVSLYLLLGPGPKLGPDFVGGTELEIAFEKPVTPDQIRSAVEKSGISQPDVIQVDGGQQQHRFLVRLQEVTTITDETQRLVEKKLCLAGVGAETCTHHASEVKFSPGGEKIAVRFDEEPDLDFVRTALASVPGIELRPGENNPFVQNARDHRVEIQLLGMGDRLMDALRQGLPEGATPDAPLRVEWIGPKAGAQLRDSAIKSIAITLVLIMVYVALRFDLRFSAGGVVALMHDAIGTLGILIVLGKEFNLTTVAAILTIIGYSVNDTVVIYDRVRENLSKVRGSTFSQLINLSTSEMLGRTILTGGMVILALVCFFVWGTGTLKDFALTMVIGMVLGMYSTIYVALPLTDIIDRALAKAGARKA